MRNKKWNWMCQDLNDELSNRLGFFKSIEASTMGLMEEVGELSTLLRKFVGNKKIKSTDADQDADTLKYHIGQEIADIMVYVLQISSELDIDIDTAFSKKANVLLSRTFKK